MKVQQALLAGLGLVVVLVVFWFLLYAPAGDRIDRAVAATAQAEQQQDVARGRIRALEAARSNAPDAEALLAAARSVVPDEVSMPAALRQVQDAADAAGVVILGVLPNAGVPSLADPSLLQVSVGVQAQGSYFQLVDFLRRIEDPRLTARAMLGEFIVIREDEHPVLSADLSLRMFAREPVSPGVSEPVAPDAAAPPQADDVVDGDAEDEADVEAAATTGSGR